MEKQNKRTKKEIRKTYREQMSTNNITDKLIQRAITAIGDKAAQGYDVSKTINTVVEYAYEMQ